jgi:SAM-dependent methyltransferase
VTAAVPGPAATLARLREYMVGPSRFMTLLSCFELGLVDAIRADPGATAAKLGATVGATPDAVEQLLTLLRKERFVGYDEDTGGYSLAALGAVAEGDLRRALLQMSMIKATMLRQLFYLPESVRTGTPVGLRELYGADGNLYEALADHPDLREPWAALMDNVTHVIDPWFFANIEIPAGARVLDLAGNTGLGAIDTLRLAPAPGLRVTTFDLPAKREECLRTFREHGVADRCDFIGGDVFAGVPTGFDVVLIKHFLPMFDGGDVLRILTEVYRALPPGGLVHVLAPVYPEDITDPDNYNVDFFPALFLGATMGQGGPQQVSTYRGWLEQCGFEVTGTAVKDAAEIPPDVIGVQAVLSARKPA